MPDERIPRPGTPEYAQAVDMARKLEEMAAEPVQGLVRRMTLLGWQPMYQAIVLEEVARQAMAAAANAADAVRGEAKERPAGAPSPTVKRRR